MKGYSQVLKVHHPNLLKRKCVSEIARIGGVIVFYPSKEWKAKSLKLITLGSEGIEDQIINTFSQGRLTGCFCVIVFLPIVSFGVALGRYPTNASFWNRFGTGTKPVLLVCSIPNTGTECTTTGFGRTSEGGKISNRLREVKLPLRSLQYCKKKYGEKEPVRFNLF